MAGEVTPGLRTLLGKQQCFAVEYFGADSSEPDYRDRDTADLSDAHVVSSAVRETWNKVKPREVQGPVDDFDFLGGLGFEEYEEPKHIVVIDVDHPAHLVDSSTPGHHHLYVEIPPVSFDAYRKWLEASAEIGLVSHGYVNACINRMHSDVRLPWIRKGEEGDIPLPWTGKDFFCCRCHREPQEIPEYRAEVLAERRSGFVPTKQGGRALDPGEDPEDVKDYDIKAFVWHNEGTLNRENGLFACTDCYIGMGMPSARGGWRPVGFDSLEPLEGSSHDGQIPVVDMSPLT